ncbi:hypothetical protein GIB67_031178, partial [Kingdonia uniflora]
KLRIFIKSSLFYYLSLSLSKVESGCPRRKKLHQALCYSFGIPPQSPDNLLTTPSSHSHQPNKISQKSNNTKSGIRIVFGVSDGKFTYDSNLFQSRRSLASPRSHTLNRILIWALDVKCSKGIHSYLYPMVFVMLYKVLHFFILIHVHGLRNRDTKLLDDFVF